MRNIMSLKSSSVPILGLLTWRPMAGYELKQQIQDSLGNFWSESFGQIYPQLRLLNDTKLIEEIPDNKPSGKLKNTYAITQAGRDALKEWISLAPASRPPRDELLLKVFFATEGDWQNVREHCQIAREEAVARLQNYQSISRRLDAMKTQQSRIPYWRMTLKMGISESRNFISWCDETLSEFQSIPTSNEETEE